MRIRRAWMAVGLAVCSLSGVAHAGGIEGKDAPGSSFAAPNVILISLDTLRRDALGTYTNVEASKTPALDALAADSIVFERAYAPIPHTQPSHMSMMTGLYPDVHQLWGRDRETRMSPAIVTLPELLQSAGYRTAAIVTSHWLDGKYGFARGFDSFQRLKAGLTYAERVTGRGIDVIEELFSTQRPSFVFLHYYDAHSDGKRKNPLMTLPYFSPESYRKDVVLTSDFCTENGDCATQYLVASMDEKRPLHEDELAQCRALYMCGVRYLDDHIAGLIHHLKERGLYDKTLILVTADHGEEFQEHGGLIHKQAYDEAVRVPMLVKLPGSKLAGKRVDSPASVLDIMPTVLDAVGVSSRQPVQGVSLLGVAQGGGEARERELLLAEQGDEEVYGLATIRNKLIIRPGEKPELYDLGSDPLEKRDLSRELPQLVVELTRRIDETRLESARLRSSLLRDGPKNDEEGSGQVLSDEEKAALEALGYVLDDGQ